MGKPRRILVVDDSELVLEATRDTLERAGYDVITRNQAIGTGAIVLREHPDLVLVDMNMPLLDGKQLVTTLRRHDSVARVPIVFYSSESESEMAQAVEESGADGYVSKSGTTQALL